jgi:hypothetical protein
MEKILTGGKRSRQMNYDAKAYKASWVLLLCILVILAAIAVMFAILYA